MSASPHSGSFALSPPPISAAATAQRLGFAFGRRFFFLWAAGWALLLPAWWHPRFVVLLPLWTAALLLLWLADLFQLPSPRLLTAERRWSGPLELGADATAHLLLHNASPRRLDATLTDQLPAALTGSEDFAAARARFLLAPGESAVAAFALHPLARGRISVGDAFLRIRSPWGLAERWARAPLSQWLTVLPNLRQARAQALDLTQAQRLALERRLARDTGQGREFHHLREFRDGDEARDICWTASARRGQLLTQIRRIERRQPIWLVLDCGRLMRARVLPPPGNAASPLDARLGRSKLDFAVAASLSLAETALHLGDEVGLLAYGAAVQHCVPPGCGPRQLRRLLTPFACAHTEAVEAGHARAAAHLLALQKRRALVIWLTDLAETALVPELIDAAAHLSPPHLLLLGAIRQSDVDAMAASTPATAGDLYLVAAAQQLRLRRQEQLARLRQHGALTLEIGPAGLASALVRRYLDLKQAARL